MYKAIDKWLPGYLLSLLRRPRKGNGVRDLIFCTADHFEPCGHTIAPDGTITPGRSPEQAADHVRRWLEYHYAATNSFTDHAGNCPRHTVFYAAEEYVPECVELLMPAIAENVFEFEIHLHHRNDTAEGLREKLLAFAAKLQCRLQTADCRPQTEDSKMWHVKLEACDEGMLNEEHAEVKEESNESEAQPHSTFYASRSTEDLQNVRFSGLRSNPPTPFAFLHGNWALCNSRPDRDWCGVDNELDVLSECGCYADFTFPSAPSQTQPRMVNCIYRPVRDGRRAADHGVPVRAGNGPPPPDALPMIIQGPLAVGLRSACVTKPGLLPALTLDAALIAPSNPPSARRVDRWVRAGIHLPGRPEWSFVKIHTHGCDARIMNDAFVSATRMMHEHLTSRYNDGQRWRLHYVTAREMYNIIRAAEDGHSGNPDDYRDYEIALNGMWSPAGSGVNPITIP